MIKKLWEASLKQKKNSNLFAFEKYISEKLSSLNIDQFGFNSFGLIDEIKPSFLNILKGKKEMYLGSYLINKKLH